MGSLLASTLNTRALPIGNLRYIRSDYPGKLTDREVEWLLQNDITTIVDLREESLAGLKMKKVLSIIIYL